MELSRRGILGGLVSITSIVTTKGLTSTGASTGLNSIISSLIPGSALHSIVGGEKKQGGLLTPKGVSNSLSLNPLKDAAQKLHDLYHDKRHHRNRREINDLDHDLRALKSVSFCAKSMIQNSRNAYLVAKTNSLWEFVQTFEDTDDNYSSKKKHIKGR